MTRSTFSILTLPGYDSSRPDHWQSHWERARGYTRVEQDDWLLPKLETWGARLDEAIARQSAPVILVPHSASSALVPIWASRSPLANRVVGAFIVAPSDTEKTDMLPVVRALGPMPTAPLPFKSLLVLSDSDPYCDLARGEGFAAAWGSERRVLENAGHINTASGHGPWPEGLSWFETWMETL